MNESKRSKVLVLGTVPVDAVPFVERGLTLEAVQLEDLNDPLLNDSCGVILAEFPGRYRLVGGFFSGHFRRACELGLRTTVFSLTPTDSFQIVKCRDTACADINPKHLVPGVVWADIGEKLPTIAEKFARHDAGPQLGGVKIELLDPALKVDNATVVLLKRAFSDCDKIVVELLPGGKTAKETFRVFASTIGPEHGPQPMPFFVKIGTAAMIEDEKENYRRRAEPFIPFHLRPALNVTRCVTTMSSAALVCNFVESAVPLRIAWRNGQGAGTIFSLFEVTLRGLRGHAARAPKEPGVLATFLDKKIRAREIRTEPQGAARIARAKQLGMRREPEELNTMLMKRAESIEARWGTYHGDLHHGNVMVRNRDAIVIDFGSMKDFGPITADSAVLEVSMVFGADDRDDPKAFTGWKEFVDELFVNKSPLRPPVHDAEHFRFAWLRKAVRELRHVGSCCDIEPDEALIVLAGCLLRYGRLSALEFPKRNLVKLSEDRRAYALVVAEHICSTLSGGHAKS